MVFYWTTQKTFRSWFVIGDWRISTRFVCFVIVIMIDALPIYGPCPYYKIKNIACEPEKKKQKT